MNFEHLKALSAIVATGSFDGAANLLGITPSAVSQRIKALETSAGQILVRRSLPSSPTEAGAILLRTARQIQALEADALQSLGQGPAGRATVSVAVNADSLATWFIPVLHEAATWADTELDLHIEDQDHSSSLLRQGDVLGAVTTEPKPVGGCRAELLGVMRYIPAASLELQQRYETTEGINWPEMPMLRFSANDDMQHRLLRSQGVERFPPTHTIPSSEGFLEAARSGLGWGMIPEQQLQPGLRKGGLVPLPGAAAHDVALYWQCWSLASPRLERITAAVRAAAIKLRQN
ncbi:LysR family transcriptional regulator ArgP [Arthrobacter sp. 2RAF6]|uniref:LysR family transcriptional regulator ArgP n=1 Tax=Arthrobacter sp. 2RAF6 TaxID=3233002 RepID=UPI003F8DD419